ncbi:Os01g0730400, partial [Oryza sativa Japonica Group]
GAHCQGCRQQQGSTCGAAPCAVLRPAAVLRLIVPGPHVAGDGMGRRQDGVLGSERWRGGQGVPGQRRGRCAHDDANAASGGEDGATDAVRSEPWCWALARYVLPLPLNI